MITDKFLLKILSLIALMLAFDSVCKAEFPRDSTRLRSKNQLDITSSTYPTAIDFTFQDTSGKNIHLSDFKGNFVLIDLWYTGCGACIIVNEALKEVHQSLQKEKVIFINISIDKQKEKWIQSLSKKARPSQYNNWAGKYVPANGTITLYTSGSGEDNEFVKKYVPSRSYPQLLFIGPKGELLSATPPRPDPDPSVLIRFIKNFLK